MNDATNIPDGPLSDDAIIPPPPPVGSPPAGPPLPPPPGQGYPQTPPYPPSSGPNPNYQTTPQFPPPAPPKRKLPTGAKVGIAGGSLLLVLLLIFTFVWLNAGSDDSAQKSDETAETQKPKKKTSTASSATEAVELFLDALADGDADSARKLAGGTSSDSLLVDEVLKQSLKFAPISNVEVDEDTTSDDKYSETVSATFDVGEKTITRDFKVFEIGDNWTVNDGLMSVSLSSFKGLDAKVNGVSPKEDYAKVFPGTYEITLGQEAFQLDGTTDKFMLASRDDESLMNGLKPVLTEAATETYRSLVRASLTECLALTTLATPCGMTIPGTLSDGAVPIEGTAVRTLSTEGDAALNAMKPESNYNAPTVVSTYDYINISTTIEADKDGQRVSGSLMFGSSLLKPNVDFSKETLTVSWE